MSDPFPVPPSGKRLYAHLRAFEVVCPQCGLLYRCGYQATHKRDPTRGGYDPTTGIYRCPAVGCGYRAYVGLVLWPLGGSHHPARPPDHVLTPGEAQRARYEASYASEGRLGGRRERVTNVECTCGQPCAVHTPPGPLKDLTPDWLSMRRKLQEDP